MKIARAENGMMVSYEFSTYEEAFTTINSWKKEFIENNNVSRPHADESYKRYCKTLDDFLLTFEVKETCDKCQADQHEGSFCRCELRNIQLARKRRAHGRVD